MKYKIGFFIIVVAGCLGFFSCEQDPDDVVNPKPPGAGEQEVITTLILNCISPDRDTIRAKFKDGDGSGGNDWILDSLILKANTTYSVYITLLDESNSLKVKDVTGEIEEEKDFHQFFYYADRLGITTGYLDTDNNNLPVGLKFSLTTTQKASGIFTVKLSHFAEGQVKDGITPIGGTDIYVEFPTRLY